MRTKETGNLSLECAFGCRVDISILRCPKLSNVSSGLPPPTKTKQKIKSACSFNENVLLVAQVSLAFPVLFLLPTISNLSEK